VYLAHIGICGTLIIAVETFLLEYSDVVKIHMMNRSYRFLAYIVHWRIVFSSSTIVQIRQRYDVRSLLTVCMPSLSLPIATMSVSLLIPQLLLGDALKILHSQILLF
jgi:hypothetical protein